MAIFRSRMRLNNLGCKFEARMASTQMLKVASWTYQMLADLASLNMRLSTRSTQGLIRFLILTDKASDTKISNNKDEEIQGIMIGGYR